MRGVELAVWVAVAVAGAGGCRSAAPTGPAPSERKAPVAAALPAPKALGARSYGAALSAAPDADHDLTKLLADPDTYADAHVTVSGVVRQVCQRRGCWLELAADASPDAIGCRVVSQQHAFFVPRDSVGQRARVEGTVEVRSVSAQQVAHMESEGGRFKTKLADGSARELRIAAIGVELEGARKAQP